MSEGTSIYQAAVWDTIRRIQENQGEHKSCMDIFFEMSDRLFVLGQPSVNGLLEQLSSPDEDTLIVTMLFLGLLNQMGLDTTSAVPTVKRNVVATDMLNFTSVVAFEMLGDPGSIEIRNKFMREKHMTSVRDWRSKLMATSIAYVCKRHYKI